MRNRAHLTLGFVTFLGFICTGVYLRLHQADLVDGPEAIRIAFRANHIYILMSALINLTLGVYSGPFQACRPGRLIGSVVSGIAGRDRARRTGIRSSHRS